jgi:hypothetical protein
MPTVVKMRAHSNSASTSRAANGLAAIALVLGIVVAAALLAAISSPSSSVDTGSDINFFAP